MPFGANFMRSQVYAHDGRSSDSNNRSCVYMSGGRGDTCLSYPTMLYATHQKKQQQKSSDMSQTRALSIHNTSKVIQVKKDQREMRVSFFICIALDVLCILKVYSHEHMTQLTRPSLHPQPF